MLLDREVSGGFLLASIRTIIIGIIIIVIKISRVIIVANWCCIDKNFKKIQFENKKQNNYY